MQACDRNHEDLEAGVAQNRAYEVLDGVVQQADVQPELMATWNPANECATQHPPIHLEQRQDHLPDLTQQLQAEVELTEHDSRLSQRNKLLMQALSDLDAFYKRRIRAKNILLAICLAIAAFAACMVPWSEMTDDSTHKRFTSANTCIMLPHMHMLHSNKLGLVVLPLCICKATHRGKYKHEVKPEQLQEPKPKGKKIFKKIRTKLLQAKRKARTLAKQRLESRAKCK
eukprot:768666-Hanusia_phi.AAC.1